MNPTLEALKALPAYDMREVRSGWLEMVQHEFGAWILKKDVIAALQAEQGQERASNLVEAGALRQFCHNDGSSGYVAAYDRTITDRFLANLKPTPPAEQWVSVKERLPEPFADVQVWPHPTEYCNTARSDAQGKWQYSEYGNWGVEHVGCTVTHWMKVDPPIDSTDAGDKHE